MNTRDRLIIAKLNKKDEFYTKYEDVKREMESYQNTFKNQIVYCNCDDFRVSAFVQYFKDNFFNLGLKKLIATHFSLDIAHKYTLTADGETVEKLNGNGDFRSDECVAILKEADIICSNPPFSLKNEYFQQLIEHKKKFIILCLQNAITTKIISKYVLNNQLWFGESIKGGGLEFEIPSYYDCTATQCRTDTDGKRYITMSGLKWLTNVDYPSRYKWYKTGVRYDKTRYDHYDNYDAIHIQSLKEIPDDYNGVMGVPVTFVRFFNPEQFEYVGFRKGSDNRDLRVKNKDVFSRYLIQRKGVSL